MSRLGVMRMDGVDLDIVEIRLERGMIIFRGSRRVNASVSESAEISIYDIDGNLVFRAPGAEGGKVVTSANGGWLHSDFPVRITDMQRQRGKPPE